MLLWPYPSAIEYDMLAIGHLPNPAGVFRSVVAHVPRMRSPHLALLVAAAFITLFGNLSFWAELSADLPRWHPQSLAILLTVFLVQFAVYHLLLGLLCWRWTLKPVLLVLMPAIATCAYFIDHLGVYVDPDMLRNVAQTDPHEAAELLTPRLALYVVFVGLLPALHIALQPLQFTRGWRFIATRVALCLALLLAALLALLAFNRPVFFVGRQHRDLEHLMNPYYPIASGVRLARQQWQVHQRPVAPDPVGRVASRIATPAGETPRVVVMVVGETARAADFQIYGYGRQTNPELSQLPLVNLGPAQSCGTATAVSVPCMFSILDRQHYNERAAASHVNAIDVLHTAGVPTHWLDNDEGCKKVCGQATYVDLRRQSGPDCGDGDCRDQALVDALPAVLDNIHGDTLIVLHQEGSHGPTYYQRYPGTFRKFAPDCRRADLQDCSHDEVVNAYDNTILYTDHVLAEIVKLLQQRQDRITPMMFYLSDHGESLGESGLYLHGMPYAVAPAEQKTVPFLAWLPNSFEQRDHLQASCLQKLPNAGSSQDQVFSMLLGLFSVSSDAYNASLDPLAACRAA